MKLPTEFYVTENNQIIFNLLSIKDEDLLFTEGYFLSIDIKHGYLKIKYLPEIKKMNFLYKKPKITDVISLYNK